MDKDFEVKCEPTNLSFSFLLDLRSVQRYVLLNLAEAVCKTMSNGCEAIEKLGGGCSKSNELD